MTKSHLTNSRGAHAANLGLGKTAPPLTWLDSTHVRSRGRKLVYMAGCDYFRLSWDPRVRRALVESVGETGLNTAASRITTGNHLVYERLEKELASVFKVEAAVLTSNGYGAALALAQALPRRFACALIDAKAHACLKDASRAWDFPVHPFPHRDGGALKKLAMAWQKKGPVIVVTDALFAHDGSLPPLKEYRSALPRRSILMVDEAHSAGVMGKHGRGVVEALGLEAHGILQTITLSKAFGVYGGAVLCSNDMKQRIVNSSRFFAGNTPLPLPLAAAARVAVRILKTEPHHRQRLQENVRYFHRLRPGSLDEDHSLSTMSPIVGVNVSNESARRRLHSRLLKAGIFPSYIRYPNVSRKGFFRFALCSEHTKDQLARLAEALEMTGF